MTTETAELFPILEKPRRVVSLEGCPLCEDIAKEYGGFGPPHDASSRCESGHRTHCSCDVCF